VFILAKDPFSLVWEERERSFLYSFSLFSFNKRKYFIRYAMKRLLLLLLYNWINVFDCWNICFSVKIYKAAAL